MLQLRRKKQAVIEKMARHDEIIREQKSQMEKATEIKRELMQKLARERLDIKQMAIRL